MTAVHKTFLKKSTSMSWMLRPDEKIEVPQGKSYTIAATPEAIPNEYLHKKVSLLSD